MVSREGDRCLGALLLMGFIVTLSGTIALLAKGWYPLGILCALGCIGIITFFVIYSIRFYQAKARGQDPYTKGSLFPKVQPKQEQTTPTSHDPRYTSSLADRLLLLEQLAKTLVFDPQIAQWNEQNRYYSTIEIGTLDLPALVYLVINNHYSANINHSKNDFETIARIIQIFGAKQVKKDIIRVTENFDEPDLVSYAKKFIGTIFPDRNL